MGEAPPVLEPRRALALVVLLAALAAYHAYAGVLPNMGKALDVAWVALLVMPASFAVAWLGLPLTRARGLLLIGIALGVLAFFLYLAGLDALFNVTKLCAYTVAGLWFLELFEALGWVVLVSLVVPWVDVISVWRGPTNYVVTEEPGLFDRVSVAFRLPGEDATGNIGPPDVVFFALFLATAARFGLRTAATWIGMIACLGLTVVLAAFTDIGGLPALPAVALGFLAPNADLIWSTLRRRETAPS